jgi:GT2 family glycosyltransferase
MEELEPYFSDQNIVALSNSVIKPNGEIDLKHRGITNFKEMFPNIQQPIPLEYYQQSIVEIHTASFVGLLIKSSAIKLIGFPIQDFFIHNDDIEYCLRLMQIGKVLLIPSSKIKHKEASNTGTKRIEYEKLWLKYYGRRNLIILANKYSQNKFKFYYKLFKSTIRSILGILLHDDHKVKRIKFTISSVLDGLRNRLDNDKPKKILYK